MPKFSARRDANEPELVTFAKNLGWRLWKLDKPADWLALRRGRFEVVEIKNPDCEGHADEFTYDERKFLAEVAAVGGRVLLWRTKDDILKDSNARYSV